MLGLDALSIPENESDSKKHEDEILTPSVSQKMSSEARNMNIGLGALGSA
jgi:hypothetical protein